MPTNLAMPHKAKADKLTRDALATVDQFNLSLLSKGRTRLPSYEPLIAYLQHVVPAPGFPSPQPLELITFALIELSVGYGLPTPTMEAPEEGVTREQLSKMVLDDINTRASKFN